MYCPLLLGIFTLYRYRSRDWWSECIPSPRPCTTYRCQKRSGPIDCWFQWIPWGIWDAVGIGPSLGSQEPRIILRGSVQLVGWCVPFGRKIRGSSWACACNRCDLRSWCCWSSLESVQLLPGGWHGVLVHLVDVTTMRWSCCEWGKISTLIIPWCIGSHTPPSCVCVWPSVPRLLVGSGSQLSKSLEYMRPWWVTGFWARWGLWQRV